MDRGIPTEEVLAEMRASQPPIYYLVGTPKGRLTRYEKELLESGWQSGVKGCKLNSCLKLRNFMCWLKAPIG